jgi:hypothetical protein
VTPLVDISWNIRHRNDEETPMGFNTEDALDAAKDITTNTIEKSSDIVGNARDIIRGDIAGGVSEIVQNSLDIATYAFDRAVAVFTGTNADGTNAGNE